MQHRTVNLTAAAYMFKDNLVHYFPAAGGTLCSLSEASMATAESYDLGLDFAAIVLAPTRLCIWVERSIDDGTTWRRVMSHLPIVFDDAYFGGTTRELMFPGYPGISGLIRVVGQGVGCNATNYFTLANTSQIIFKG